MLSRRSIGLFGFCFVVAALATSTPRPGLAAGQADKQKPAVLASLDGRPIAISRAHVYHCHDLAAGELRCFRSAQTRDAAVVELLATRQALMTGPSPNSVASTGYVIAYLHAGYAGSSVVLSQDYINLGSIGWSDIISSYKVYTTLTGAFYENTFYAGRYQSYCCLSNVVYVGDGLNDIFSSFNLP